jgi:hypothetical protein
MLPLRLAHPTAALGARLLPAVAAIAAIGAFGAFPAGAPGGAESLYLAFAAGVVLLSAAAVAPRPGVEVAAGALVVTLAAWALPEGPARGAVVTALAASTLAVAAARRLGTRGDREGTAGWPLPPVAVVGLTLGCQALLRGGELLHAGSALRAAAVFVAFPAAGALAVLALAPLHGRRAALLAGAAAILVAPGFRPASVAALVALAAGSWLFATGRPASGDRSGVAVAIGAALLLVAPFAWDARAAGSGLAAGLTAGALVGRTAPSGASRGPWRRPATLLGTASAAVLLLVLSSLPGRPAGEVLALASRVVLAVPALLLVIRGRAAAAVAALLLAGAAARGVFVDGFLAAPAALAVVAALSKPVSGRAEIREGAFRRGVRAAQGAWSAIALGLAALLGAYPWLRSDPFGELLPRFGLAETPVAALLAALALAAVAALGLWDPAVRTAIRARARAGAISAWAAVVVLAVLLVAHLPPAGAAALGRQPVVLDAERPAWSAPAGGPLAAGSAGTVVFDSSLANSVGLHPGAPVATVRLRRAGAPDRTWVLRAGVETGEWAADRPDLRAAGEDAPEAWQSWVAEEGGFFGRRYRAAHRFEAGIDPGLDAREAVVAVELRDDLPEEVSLTLFHVEVRP